MREADPNAASGTTRNSPSPSPAAIALAEQLRAGDHAAFTAFVEQHYARVVRVAYSIVHSADAAKDIAQELFIRMWERRDTLDATRVSVAYMITAAHHRALDERKRAKVRERHRETTDPANAVTASGEELLLSRTSIQAALAALPERWQLALRLRTQEQIPIPDIAVVLGISPNATHQLLHRAIRALRARLGEG